MKKVLFNMLLLSLIALSCRKPQDLPALSSVLLPNEWRVGYCRDHSANLTSLYSTWLFSFRADSTVAITNGVTQYTGTWSEDVNRKKLNLNINAATFEAAVISREWDIVLITPGRVKLADNKFAPFQELYLDTP